MVCFPHTVHGQLYKTMLITSSVLAAVRMRVRVRAVHVVTVACCAHDVFRRWTTVDRLFTRQHVDVLSPRMTRLGHFVKRTRTVYWVLTLFICAYKASKFSYYCTQKRNLLHELEASLVCGHQSTKYLKLSDFNLKLKCTQLGPIDRATKLKWLG